MRSSGWTCERTPSLCSSSCGDGVRADMEACDDGNQVDGDGCSEQCEVERGWSCDESSTVVIRFV